MSMMGPHRAGRGGEERSADDLVRSPLKTLRAAARESFALVPATLALVWKSSRIEAWIGDVRTYPRNMCRSSLDNVPPEREVVSWPFRQRSTR